MGITRKGSVIAVCTSERKGTIKKPQSEVILVEKWGVEGDAHGGTQRQVSLLSMDSIRTARSWGLDVGPGSFAENITFEGIDIEDIKQGTLLKVGESILMVTQIGKSCHVECEIKKLSGRCVMPSEGIFAKVIRGGRVSPGDDLEIIQEPMNLP